MNANSPRIILYGMLRADMRYVTYVHTADVEVVYLSWLELFYLI